MVNLSNIIDVNLRNAIKTIMKTKSTNPEWQDYEVLNHALSEGNKDVVNYLLDHNCTINRSTSPPIETSLHYAVKLADTPIITKLLEKGASLTAVNADANSPLHLAFLLNHTEIVDLFLTHIQQTLNYEDVSNKHNLTHFHIACARGNAQVAHDFDYTGSNISTIVNKDSPVYANYSCIRFACDSKSIATIKVVLEAADPPSCCLSYTPKEQSILLKSPQDVGHRLISMHHETMLGGDARLSRFQSACFHGRLEEVKKCLEKGVDVNVVMSGDALACPMYTPLHFAMEAKENRRELVELLLENGADVDLRDGFGMTPLHLALYNNQEDGVVEMVYGAVKDKDVNPMDMFGLTYFHVAVAVNDVEMVKKFIERGESDCKPILPNLRNFAKYTPLHFAVKYGHKDRVIMLIEQGADLNANEVESQFETPLQTAIKHGHCKIVEILLEKGANAKVVTYETKMSTLHLLVERFATHYVDNDSLNLEELFEPPVNQANEDFRLPGIFQAFIEFSDDKVKRPLVGLVKTLVKYGADVDAKDDKLNTALHRACEKMDEQATMVRELLLWGTDINAKNWRLETAFDIAWGSVKETTYRNFTFFHYHTQELKMLGLRVDSKNEKFCQMIEEKRNVCQEKDPKLELFFKCIYDSLHLEVEQLKKDMLDESVSLCDYLRMDVERAAGYVKNKRICQLTDGDRCYTYPNYGRLVVIMHWKSRHWLEAQQPKKQSKIEKLIVVKKPLVRSKPLPPSTNLSKLGIPAKATLHEVVTLGNVQRVKEMLARGATIRVFNSTKNSPLHLAFTSNHMEIVDLLLAHIKQKSVYFNLKNIHGLTHLHIAASRGNTFTVQKLLEARANPTDFVDDNSPYYPGYSALRFACESKSLATIKLLSRVMNLFSHVSLEEEDEFADLLDTATLKFFIEKLTGNKLSPFHNACLVGSVEDVDEFLDNGADVNATSDRDSKMNPSYTALHFAVDSVRDRQEKVELLLHHDADVDRKNGFCMTPLHQLFYADRNKDMREEFCEEDETLRMLYEATENKETNPMDACGLTYFHVAAAVNDCHLVKKMLFNGEDIDQAVLPNARGFSKYTPLHFAAEHGEYPMVKLLVDRGAKIDANEDDLRYNTPLQTAIVTGQARAADVLLENGANARVVRPAGKKTTLHLLTEQIGQSQSSLLTGLINFDPLWLIDKLVKLGVDIDAKDSDGRTALHTACHLMGDDARLVEALMDYGADINVKDGKGNTPLDLAVGGRYEHKAKLYHRVQAMKHLGLTVDERNDEFCKRVMAGRLEQEDEDLFSEEVLAKKKREREKEIERLKVDMISEDASLYDYLRMTPEQAAVYAKNERIKFIVEDDESRVLYEIYGYLIPVVYRKSLKWIEGRESGMKRSGKKTHRGNRKRSKAVSS